MGYYRPIGEWEECYMCDGLGVVEKHCYECNHVELAVECDYCDGVGYQLKNVYVREEGDPPPMTWKESQTLFLSEMEKSLKATFDAGFGSYYPEEKEVS